MKRAAVLIGVHKAHNLPELQAVWNGVHVMETWALSQGLTPELVKTITDETEKVTPQRIITMEEGFVRNTSHLGADHNNEEALGRLYGWPGGMTDTQLELNRYAEKSHPMHKQSV